MFKVIVLFAQLFFLVSILFGQNPEPHLLNLKQLTFGGDNAEAYWSSNNEKLCFQSNNKAWGLKCDQIFIMNLTN